MHRDRSKTQSLLAHWSALPTDPKRGTAVKKWETLNDLGPTVRNYDHNNSALPLEGDSVFINSKRPTESCRYNRFNLLFFLPDIQEYYELTILENNKCSGDQTDCPAPSEPSADLSAQPESSSASQMSQASEINPPPKPLTPKPKSVKSPAPPVPSGISPVQQTSPAASSVAPHLESTKVKYRAPPPPVQPGAVSPTAASSPSSLPSPPVSGAEKDTNSAETPEVSVNGTKPPVTATNSLSSEASISANSQSGSVSADLNLVTVSALVSSTIQGLVSPAGPDKPPRTSPALIKVPDATKPSPSLSSNVDPDNGMVTPSMSPISPSQGKLTFKQSSTGPAGPVNTELHLRWDQQSKSSFIAVWHILTHFALEAHWQTTTWECRFILKGVFVMLENIKIVFTSVVLLVLPALGE